MSIDHLCICLQKDSDVAKAGITLKTFFESLVQRFLPYINLSSIDPSKDYLPSTNAKKARKTKDKEDASSASKG
jgi:hypothetical protein